MIRILGTLLIGLRRAGFGLFPLSLACLLVAFVITARAERLNEDGLPYLYPRQPYSLEDLPSCNDKDANRTIVAGGRFLQCYPGNINGTKLLIPNYFLLSYPEYDGRNWLSREPLNVHPTFENRITKFAIELRSSTLLPIVTAADFAERLKPPKDIKPTSSLWLTVGFEPDFAAGPSFMDREQRAVFDLEQDRIRPAGNLYGLELFESETLSRERFEQGLEKSWKQVLVSGDRSTIITCHTHAILEDRTNTFRTCRHHFSVGRLNLVASAHLWGDALQKWSLLEVRTRQIIDALIFNP